MAGYNPNSSMGNDNGSLLHQLFQSAPPRQDQQAPTGSQGAHGAGPSFQTGPGYNQSLLHEFQSMNDTRSNYSSRVASPSVHQQPGMFRANSGTPPVHMAPVNLQKNDQKSNLLHLLQAQRPPQQEPRGDTSFNPGTYGNVRAQHLDQRSASIAGADNHKAASMSRSLSQQKSASHATPDSLLALLNNQPKSKAREISAPRENGAGAQQDSTSGKEPIVNAKPDVGTAETTSLHELLGIKPQELPKEDKPVEKPVKKPVEKLAEKSADELTDELANMLSSNPVTEPVENGAPEQAKNSGQAVEIDVEQKADAANAKTNDADKTAAVNTPEIASVIDGIDNLNVGTSKPVIGKRPEKSVSTDSARAESVADDWETAADNGGDSNEGQDDTKTLVDVFNFHPLQPFISITINPEFDMPEAKFSTDEDAIMPIAKLKKAFDQNDRTLVTATKNYIIFAMSKNGGVRVVRQDTGDNKMVFEETHDQIFNVAACTDKDTASETVVATGCSGTVYWFMVRDTRGETVEDITPHHSFALPPIQSPGDENPGGVLKTRARKSSNHTKFFGVGRGKSIHIIFPNLITKGNFYKPGTARTVDVEKYLAHSTLKIDTGKAAKDFTFSQDDTTVVSLDKAGRIKFWDIRGLVEDDGKAQSVELTEPLLTLVTTPANEKSWPTSIIFIDKLRRVEKNQALRYLLVGMKQNHTLQLWDLALRRIVQEIHLPHDKDSDAACSVVYHVATSMIVVGHPTRNSIYFIHVSLPRYSMRKALSQADFMEQIGKGTVETPSNSAAFNTIREYTFSENTKPASGSDKRVRGDLRSLDVLQEPANTHDDSVLFEVYTMHSTGVHSISIRPETLGWNSKLVDIKTLSASQAGLTTYDKLKPIEQALSQKETFPSSPAASGSPAVQTTPQVKEILRKPAVSSSPADVTSSSIGMSLKRADSSPKVATGSQDSSPAVEKSEKKKKRKGSSSSRASDNSVEAAQSSSKPMPSIPETVAEVWTNKNADFDLEATLNAIFFNFEQGWDRVMDAFNIQRDTASANQAKLLNLVSETLSTQVEKALARIVEGEFKTAIAPALNEKIHEVLERSVPIHLKNILNGLVQNSVAKEVQSALSGALTKALSSPHFTKQMSQMMSQLGVARDATQQSTNETLRSVLNSVGEIQKQRAADAEKIDALLKQREKDTEAINTLLKQKQNDSEKIDKLEAVVRQLGELVSTMATAEEKNRQSSLVREDKLMALIESIQAQASNRAAAPSRDSPQGSSARPSPGAGRQLQQYEQESQNDFDHDKAGEIIKLVTQTLNEGRHLYAANNILEANKKFEFALHNWLSCGDDEMTQVIYDYCLSKEDPRFLWDLKDPIYIFITMRAVASNLRTPSVQDRFNWLNNCLRAAARFDYRNMNTSITENFPEVVLYVRNCIIELYKSTDDLHEDVARMLVDMAESCSALIHQIQN